MFLQEYSLLCLEALIKELAQDPSLLWLLAIAKETSRAVVVAPHLTVPVWRRVVAMLLALVQGLVNAVHNMGIAELELLIVASKG
jgi:hypothetical protein